MKTDESDESYNQSEYQSAVGSLLYLSIGTRPDIAFAVSNVAKFCSNPTKSHWTAVKKMFRYIKGTPVFGLLYTNMVQRNVLATQTLIGLVVQMIEDLPLDIFSN